MAVGIYISGDSRACRDQPNLTPRWVSTQLTNGWRLLPITLGPQASCQPRFPRYGDDETIDPRPGRDGNYAPGPRPGQRGGGHGGRHRRASSGIVAGQHALVRPRGLRPAQHQVPRVRAGVPERLDQPAARARLRLGGLLQRRLGHEDARRRPGQPPRAGHPPRHDLGRPVGRSGEHVDVVPALRRLAERSGQAVPGRPRRDLGGRDHQHRPQLPRRRPGPWSPSPSRTAAGSGRQLLDLRAARSPGRRHGAARGAG